MSTQPLQAVVPRQQTLVQLLASFNRRIRYLETHRMPLFPICGQAQYDYAWSPSPTAAATWTPDLSLLTVSNGDSIGCSATSSGLAIPAGWMWWAALSFTVKTSAAPTSGDSLVWSAVNLAGYGAQRSDVLVDSSGESTAQTLSVVIGGTAGVYADSANLPAMASALGTEFAPTAMSVAVWGLYNFGCSLYTDDGES